MAGRIEEPIFQLTSKHVLYFNGKAVILNAGDCFQLAGLKLSSMGNESPFHYKGEIIRLPNSILKLYDEEAAINNVYKFNVDNVKVGDTIKILRNSDGSHFEIGETIKVEAVNEYNIESYNPRIIRSSFVAHCNYEIIK